MSHRSWAAPGLTPFNRMIEIAKDAGLNPRAIALAVEAIDAAVADALAIAAPKFTPVTSGYPTEPGTYAVIGQSTLHSDTWHKIQTWTDEGSRLAWYQTGVAYWLKLPDSDSMPHIANEIEPPKDDTNAPE